MTAFASVSLSRALFMLMLMLVLTVSIAQAHPSSSIVILHTLLHITPDISHLQVKWVVSSDVVSLVDGTPFPPPSYTPPCPLFSWDGVTITGPDTHPNTHCGPMFAVTLPIPSAYLAAGTHTLRLVLADLPDAPAKFYELNSSADSVSFVLGAAAPVAANFTLAPGGNTPLRAYIVLSQNSTSTGIPKIFHRIWLSPPSLPPVPLPPTYQRFWRSWRERHSNWRFVTWSAFNVAK
jgi:hypothetical protein